jgi:hypothetical protein
MFKSHHACSLVINKFFIAVLPSYRLTEGFSPSVPSPFQIINDNPQFISIFSEE